MNTIQRAVEIDKKRIHPNPWNPNRLNPRTLEALGESINWVGQVQEILVRPHPEIENEYQIIDGEHRFLELSGSVFANIIEGLTDAEAKKLTIVMDSTRGELDKVDLSYLLKEIQIDMKDDLITALPFEVDELARLIDIADIDWNDFREDKDGPQAPPPALESNSIFFKTTQEGLDRLHQVKQLIAQEITIPDDNSWGVVVDFLCEKYLKGEY